MATTMLTRNYKRISLSMEEKARSLKVIANLPELAGNELAVTSGSKANAAYVVTHNGKNAVHCPCDAYGRCSHLIAADWHLEAKNRAMAESLFDLCGLAL